jgi:diguanylate cyclase (GGDEF)-like protein
VLLHGTGDEEAERIARHLHREMRRRKFRVDDALKLSTRASYGVATWPTDADNIEELIRLADTAMYQVKGTTRDDVATASAVLMRR